jgi:hypothetical protein
MSQLDTSSTDYGTPTHPHIASIAIEPAVWANFHCTFEDQPEVKLLSVDRSKPDVWMVKVACASRCVQDLLESNW